MRLKHIVASGVCVLAMLSAALAAPSPKNELSLSGEFLNKADAHSTYSVDLALWIPLTKFILVGPEVVVGNEQALNRIGGSVEWNLLGQVPITPYVGGSALYFQKQIDGEDSYTATASGGIKIAVGTGAAIKVFVTRIVDGRGADSTDLVGGAGIVARF